jgi:hypothetical protein
MDSVGQNTLGSYRDRMMEGQAIERVAVATGADGFTYTFG